MLTLTIPETEIFNESINEFITIPETKLLLEHSLISLSKWESKWRKPFLFQTEQRTHAELLDYIKCMSLNPIKDERCIDYMPVTSLNEVSKYIEDPMTATTFTETKNSTNREIITSELIYYWMISLNIPMECQKWHLNRLLTLIRVCSIKNAPEQKMSTQEILRRNRELNRMRREQLHTRG